MCFLLGRLILFQTFISRHNSTFFPDKLVLSTVVAGARCVLVQAPIAIWSKMYYDRFTLN
ncbi:hypothetical protein, partial [Proteus mirabilis]|uniref:hypothetical protein n=1 Tax=Proteus mirabilis TaxID=584 RepID=UPI003F68B05D